MTIPGTDGRKMSKSLKNYIDVFAEEKLLRKQVNSIVTANLQVEDPKEYSNCNVYKIYELVSTVKEQNELQMLYLNGGMGFGLAKSLLFEKILSTFSEERKLYKFYLENPNSLEEQLVIGERKAMEVAQETLAKVRAIYWG